MNDRDNRILMELLSYPSTSSQELMEKFNLTRRQLGYSIEKINKWLFERDLPNIKRTKQGQFIIPQIIFTKYGRDLEATENSFEMTPLLEKERIYFILMMILSANHALGLDDFSDELDVSKNTVLNDLKEAQIFIKKFELAVQYTRKSGYTLEGKEFHKRKLLMHLIILMIEMNDGVNRLKDLMLIREDAFAQAEERVNKVEQLLNLKFTDERHQMMPFFLLILYRRIKRGYQIENMPIDYNELSSTKEYQATEVLLQNIDEIPLQERLFITLHLLTTNVFSTELIDDKLTEKIYPVADEMLRLFEKNACIHLQDRDELMEKLIQHLKPAYYRVKYQLTDTIYYQNTLTNEYKELHHLVKRATKPLEALIGNEMPDGEVAFITMLIGGWMHRLGESIDNKVKAVVVCPQGVSVSRLLFNEMNQLFPEFVFLDYLSVREFVKYNLEYDVVFSPISLETQKKLFVTKPFLNESEKIKFRKQVMLGVYGYVTESFDVNEFIEKIRPHITIHEEDQLKKAILEELQLKNDAHYISHDNAQTELNLSDLLNEDTIQVVNHITSWEDAVKKSALPLINNHSINQTYVNAMIKYSKEDSYIAIAPGVAIPHAAPEDGAAKVGMSLLRINEGVKYTEDNKIYFVITIAAVDKTQHIHALMQLMRFTGSEKNRQKMHEAKTVKELNKLIKVYINEKK